VAFPIAAALVGELARRGWHARRPLHALAAMLLGHAVCLGLGAAWLARAIGPDLAWHKGVAPFLLGAVVKSILVVAVLRLMPSIAQPDTPNHEADTAPTR